MVSHQDPAFRTEASANVLLGDDETRRALAEESIESSQRFIEAYPRYRAKLPYILAHAVQNAPPKILWNPYSHQKNARQLDETIDAFLERLPPSAAVVEDDGFIWVANPHAERHPVQDDLAGLTRAGQKILSSHAYLKEHVEKNSYPKTKKAKDDRERLVTELREAAIKYHVLTGKWMLFPSVRDIDQVWKDIVTAVVEDRLGIAAKVATTDGSRGDSGRLICVYTRDFTDGNDVWRVLEELFNIDMVKRKPGDGRGIYYKCDAYTHLGIESGNEWSLKASIYSSISLTTAAAGPNIWLANSKRKAETSDANWEF